MDSGWAAAIPTVITAVATWYLRRGSKNDTAKAIQETASDSDMRSAKKDLEVLRAEFELFKAVYFKQNPVIDHRGPTKGDKP